MGDQARNVEVSEVIVRFSQPVVQEVEKPIVEVRERKAWEWVLFPIELLLDMIVGAIDEANKQKPVSRVEIRIHR